MPDEPPPQPGARPPLWESFLAVLLTAAVLLGIVGLGVLLARWFPPNPH